MFHVNAWGIPYGACMAGCKARALLAPAPRGRGRRRRRRRRRAWFSLSSCVPLSPCLARSLARSLALYLFLVLSISGAARGADARGAGGGIDQLVLPGAGMDGASLAGLMAAEGVTTAAGVPTIWQGLLAHLDATEVPRRARVSQPRPATEAGRRPVLAP